MRLIVDEKNNDEKNRQILEQMKANITQQIPTLNELNGIYKGARTQLTNVANAFVDEKGAMLATSTVALNLASAGLEVAIDVWKQWREYNSEMAEYNETLRRLGVGDMTNTTDLRRGIFTGNVSKRRY